MIVGWPLAVVLSCAPLGAQVLLWSKVGQACQERLFGNTLALGDLNGDGYDDFATGVEYRPACGLRKEIWTWSGRDGARLGAPWVVGYTHSEINVRVVGDLDGDGFRDVTGVVWPCNPSCAPMIQIEARSGRDRSFLWGIQGPRDGAWGLDHAGDIDVNGDGTPDVVVCEYRANNFAGAVHVHEGRTGRLLYSIVSTPSLTQEFGRCVAKLGDLDGDGCEDFVVGCGHLSPVQADVVVAISGRTGVALRIGVNDGSRGGTVERSVTGCGDVDGDGVVDFAGGGYGNVIVFAGGTGAILHRIRPYAGQSFLGDVLRGGQDLDQDGVPDLVAGTTHENSALGRVYAFSGRDGSTLWSVGPVDNYNNNLGVWESVGLLPPQPGNPFPLVVIGEDSHGSGACATYCPPALGLFRVLRSSPPGVDAYGAACATGGAAPPRIGIRAIRNGVRLTVAQGPAGGIGVLLLGTSRTSYGGIPLPLPLGFLGLPTCLLQTSIDLTLPVALGQTGIDRGYAPLDLPVTLSASGPPTVFAQWVVFGGTPLAATGLSQPLSLAVR